MSSVFANKGNKTIRTSNGPNKGPTGETQPGAHESGQLMAIRDLEILSEDRLEKGFLYYQTIDSIINFGLRTATSEETKTMWDDALCKLRFTLSRNMSVEELLALAKELFAQLIPTKLDEEKKEAKAARKAAARRARNTRQSKDRILEYNNGYIEHEIPKSKQTTKMINVVKYCLDNSSANTSELSKILGSEVNLFEEGQLEIQMPSRWPDAQMVVKQHTTNTEYQNIKDLLRTPTLEWFLAVVPDTDDED